MLLAFLYHTFDFLRPKRHFVFYFSAKISSRGPKTTSGYSFISEDNESCQNASARSIFLFGNLIQYKIHLMAVRLHCDGADLFLHPRLENHTPSPPISPVAQ